MIVTASLHEEFGDLNKFNSQSYKLKKLTTLCVEEEQLSDKDARFNEARSSVLSLFLSAQTSLATLLIGYAVALFTLFELFKDLGNGLSEKFQLGITFNIIPVDAFSWLKLALLFIGALLLTTYIVRTIHRYAAYSGMSNNVICMAPFEFESKTDKVTPIEFNPINLRCNSLQCAIMRKAYNDMKNQGQNAFLLPFNWFFTGQEMPNGDKSNSWETRLGWLFSGLIALGLVVGILILLW